jgi:hypothetical protein
LDFIANGVGLEPIHLRRLGVARPAKRSVASRHRREALAAGLLTKKSGAPVAEAAVNANRHNAL